MIGGAKDFSIVVILEILKKLQDKIFQVKNEAEKLQIEGKKVKFEELYNFYKGQADDEKASENLDLIKELVKEYNFDSKEIVEKIRKRQELAGNSGSDFIKKSYEEALEKLEAKKVEEEKKLNKILDNEELLEREMVDAIQEVDQLIIAEKLIELREHYRNESENYLKLVEKQKKHKEALEAGWTYEIYGDLSVEEIKEKIK